MRRRARIRDFVNPHVLQVLSMALVGVLVVVTVFVASNAVDRSSDSALDNARAALLSAGISAHVTDVHLLELDAAAGEEGDTVRIPIAAAIQAHDRLRLAEQAALELNLLVGSPTTRQIEETAASARFALQRFLQSESGADFTQLREALVSLRALTNEHQPVLAAAAQDEQHALRAATNLAWIIIAVIAALAVAFVTALTVIIGRRLSRALEQAQAEQANLMDASRAMARRNEQFTALYQIVSEVTETLSLKYVIGTTIREARKLVGADIVALRLVQNDKLVLVGSEQDIEEDAHSLTTLPLGVGVVGRAAKRGKTVRISEDAESSMLDGERIAGVQSGIVVPLIVGARVVGTLGCWSRIPALFSDDDERILEMMASQVATAIAAANVHEASEREAHHDALTSLPNRRQLTEDLRGPLLEATLGARHMAIAMLDIDHFKRLNDEYGHKVGDVTLQRVAETLRACVRGQDRVYRYGGEEFLVVFADADSQLGGVLAERLRAAVERMPLLAEQGEPAGPVTISIGVAAYPDDGQHVEALIDTADQAMYASKQGGRNRVSLARECLAEDSETPRAA
jgi:diguanylate cyclase (GGDEF)-like protein